MEHSHQHQQLQLLLMDFLRLQQHRPIKLLLQLSIPEDLQLMTTQNQSNLQQAANIHVRHVREQLIIVLVVTILQLANSATTTQSTTPVYRSARLDTMLTGRTALHVLCCAQLALVLLQIAPAAVLLLNILI